MKKVLATLEKAYRGVKNAPRKVAQAIVSVENEICDNVKTVKERMTPSSCNRRIRLLTAGIDSPTAAPIWVADVLASPASISTIILSI